MSKQTGGPAFPREDYEANGGNGQLGQEGMTLRDYFAAKAMQGALAASDSAERNYTDPRITAENAYMIADAMIAIRNKE